MPADEDNIITAGNCAAAPPILHICPLQSVPCPNPQPVPCPNPHGKESPPHESPSQASTCCTWASKQSPVVSTRKQSPRRLALQPSLPAFLRQRARAHVTGWHRAPPPVGPPLPAQPDCLSSEVQMSVPHKLLGGPRGWPPGCVRAFAAWPAPRPSCWACGSCRCLHPAPREHPGAGATPLCRHSHTPRAGHGRNAASGVDRTGWRRGPLADGVQPLLRVWLRAAPRRPPARPPGGGTCSAMDTARSYRHRRARGQSTTVLRPHASCVDANLHMIL